MTTFDGSPAHLPVQVVSEPKLRIIGDQTIMMWVKPDSIGAEMQLFSQCYGGEGSITLQSSGQLRYSYGTAGARRDPYQQVVMIAIIRLILIRIHRLFVRK